MRRIGLVAAGFVCLVLAASAVLVAADVWSWRSALRAGDVRYEAAPSDGGLWSPRAIVPLATARKTLGVDDDLNFRRALRAMRLGKLEDARTSDTEALIQRSEAQSQLEAIVAKERDPARRSRALTLLGVILLATPVQTSEEQRAALKAAVTNLRTAIQLNPNNSEAKFNLEFALRQRSAGLSARGGGLPNPGGNSNTSRGAATGSPGSGY